MRHAAQIPETVTLHVPFRVVRRGGRKEMQLPPVAASKRKADNTLIKALARAHRWQKLLEEAEYATVRELAEAEKINAPYLGRVLRLTLLAPDMIEAILEGQPVNVGLSELLRGLPMEWEHQRTLLLAAGSEDLASPANLEQPSL
ncbi:hypothetical protein [Tropicimonas marinistellae]|uniref:hypothetical protein n=1 Tax=Tropicimonas marinistellae TaxID=1739787 RepID=UPI00082978BC|nr:hypothetical protein [Tropicimonas marinistellae]